MTHHQALRGNSCARLLLGVVLLWGCGAPATLSRVERNSQAQTTLTGISSDDVLVVRTGVGALSPPPRHLQDGDQLSTGPTTRVLLRFANSMYVLVEPNTRVTIGTLTLNGPKSDRITLSQYKGSPTVDELKPVGKIYVRSRKGSTKTEWYSAQVRGTRYMMSLDADAHSVLQTYTGTVAVVSRHGAWPPIDVHEGEAVTVDGDGSPAKRALTSEDLTSLDAAFEAFDRLLDLNF